jgi:hypothetical protein
MKFLKSGAVAAVDVHEKQRENKINPSMKSARSNPKGPRKKLTKNQGYCVNVL